MNGCMPYTGEIYLLGRVVKGRYNCVKKKENTVRRGIKKKTNAFAGQASEGRRRTREAEHKRTEAKK